VHEHRHEQAPGTVVDPHHEHPISWQYRYIEKKLGQEEQRGERSGSSAAPPEGHNEVLRSPQEAHDKPGGKDPITLSQFGHGEPRPAWLFEEAAH